MKPGPWAGPSHDVHRASNIFNGAVQLLVGLWQLGCIFTAELCPLAQAAWVHLHQMPRHDPSDGSSSGPPYEDGKRLVHHAFTARCLPPFLNPVLAILSLVLFERSPRPPLRQVWWRWCRRSHTVCMICTAILQEPSISLTPFMRVYDQTIQETLMWFAIILVTNLLYAFPALVAGRKREKKQGGSELGHKKKAAGPWVIVVFF